MVNQPNSERGSVTAEFALVLPAVCMVLAIAIGGLGLQVERICLVGLASNAARSIARGEPENQVVGDSLSHGVSAQVSNQGNLVCVTAYKEVSIMALPEALFRIEETQCSRMGGL